MSIQSFDFSNQVGQEMLKLLEQRASEQLADATGFDRYTAMLLASLIPVAEVLRDPTAQARDSGALPGRHDDLHIAPPARAARTRDSQELKIARAALASSASRWTRAERL